MPNPMLVLAGASAGASIIGGISAGNAAESAADSQAASAQQGIDEQRRQFDSIQELMSPFVSSGTDAFQQMANLAGVGGQEAIAARQNILGPFGRPGREGQAAISAEQAQATAISGIENSPAFMAAVQQGENAMLQNASATGGLRGGNTQAALAQFRPAMLSQAIDRQYAQLGGLANMGQAAAGNQAAAGQNFANNASSLYGQQGAAAAGGALAQGAAFQQGLGGVGNAFGNIMSGFGEMPDGATPFGQWGF